MKLPSDRLVLLVLEALLGAAVFVIYRLSFALLMTNQNFQFVEERNEALRKMISDELCVSCDKDWEPNGRNCYYFTTNTSSWNESRAGCKAKGGDLVKIDSRVEQTFLEARLRDKTKKYDDCFWIDLTDPEVEGRWMWVDGSYQDKGLTFWRNGEPNNWTGKNPAGEDCVRMGEIGGAADLKCWIDHDCNFPHKSICEKAAET